MLFVVTKTNISFVWVTIIIRHCY